MTTCYSWGKWTAAIQKNILVLQCVHVVFWSSVQKYFILATAVMHVVKLSIWKIKLIYRGVTIHSIDNIEINDEIYDWKNSLFFDWMSQNAKQCRCILKSCLYIVCVLSIIVLPFPPGNQKAATHLTLTLSHAEITRKLFTSTRDLVMF